MSKQWKCLCGKVSPLSENLCPYCKRPLGMYGAFVTDDQEPEIPYRPYTGEESEGRQVGKQKQPKKERKPRHPKERNRGSAGKSILIVLLLLIILLMGAVIALLLGRETAPDPEPTLPPAAATTPVDTATDPTEPADTQPIQTDPPATDPPATEPPVTDPPATEPPATEADLPWKDNVIASDFRLMDYWAKGRLSIDNTLHLLFVDNLRLLEELGSRGPWDISEERDGSVLLWVHNRYSHGDSTIDRVRCNYDCNTTFIIGAEGGVNASLACEGMFDGCWPLMIVDFNDSFHIDGATSMAKMFNGCTSLTELDLRGLDTSAVTDMNAMLCGCSSLQYLDLRDIDTSNVTNMNSMLYGVGASCKIKLDPDTFDTSSVTDYENFMHYGEEINGKPWRDLFP